MYNILKWLHLKYQRASKRCDAPFFIISKFRNKSTQSKSVLSVQSVSYFDTNMFLVDIKQSPHPASPIGDHSFLRVPRYASR